MSENTAKIKIKVLEPNNKPKIIELNIDEIIGRSEDVQVTLNDNKVSSRHAQVKKNLLGHFYLEDIGSTNGIKVNGERVSEVLLVPGVEIIIGNTQISVAQEEEVKVPSPKKKKSNLALLMDILEETEISLPNKSSSSDANILKKPMVLNFCRGLLNGRSWKIYWAPLVVGTDSGIFSIIDETLSDQEKSLFQIESTTNPDTFLIRKISNLDLKVNKSLIEKESFLNEGDLVEFAKTAFKVEL